MSAESDAAFGAWLGERTRRLALGLLAALLTARAYSPSEPDVKAASSGGLLWDFAVLLVAGLALASALVGGRLRLRWSWTDAAVMTLFALVGLSAARAYDLCSAINLAWDWVAVGLCYVLVRNLPRTRGESTALVGAMTATAVACAVFGLYQVAVELPRDRVHYVANEATILRDLQIAPGSVGHMLFQDRILHSLEPMSTFGLANSLAVYLVGPLVLILALAWGSVLNGEKRKTVLGSLALASLPTLALLVCLLLTKSRSAYVGLAVALAILVWRSRRLVKARTIALAAAALIAFVGVLVAAGFATGQLDREVLTESMKSLRYRWEYWVGACRVITESPRAFWSGHGPGNFTAPYLRLKVPESSEEIADPHNMILEVGSAAGIWGMVALVAALGLAFRELFRPQNASEFGPKPEKGSEPPPLWPSDPPRSAAWLVACAGGGWLMVFALGKLNPFIPDLTARWFVLGAAWLWAILFGMPLARRFPVTSSALGLAALAMSVNLLAAGGIGFASVAGMLWTLIALGLNLGDDRGSARLRDAGGRLPAFGLALIWVGLAGTFAGTIGQFWRSEAAIAEAEEAVRARPPRYEVAEAAFKRGIEADKYNARPWLGLAALQYEEWKARGSKPEDKRWKLIPFTLAEAVNLPRNNQSWVLHRERALVTRDLLAVVGPGLRPKELVVYRGNVVEGLRRAAQLYPSNAVVHAQLADASAEIGMFSDAVTEAQKALELDKTPHIDKRLGPVLRARMKSSLPAWEKSAGEVKLQPPPNPPPSRKTR